MKEYAAIGNHQTIIDYPQLRFNTLYMLYDYMRVHNIADQLRLVAVYDDTSKPEQQSEPMFDVYILE